MILSHPLKTLLYSCLCIFLFYGCSPQEDDSLDHSLVTVKLGATLSSFSSVNVDIEEIQLQILEDKNLPEAWVTLNSENSGVFDLTSLSDQEVIILVDFEQVPSDFIYSIKILYGEENSATKGGVVYDLQLDELTENASINVVERKFKENILYELTLEMDLEASIEWSSENDPKFEPKTSALMRQFNLF